MCGREEGEKNSNLLYNVCSVDRKKLQCTVVHSTEIIASPHFSFDLFFLTIKHFLISSRMKEKKERRKKKREERKNEKRLSVIVKICHCTSKQ